MTRYQRVGETLILIHDTTHGETWQRICPTHGWASSPARTPEEAAFCWACGVKLSVQQGRQRYLDLARTLPLPTPPLISLTP